MEIIFNKVNWHLLLDFCYCLLFRPVSLQKKVKKKKSFKGGKGEEENLIFLIFNY